MKLSQNRRRTSAPSRIRYRSSGQNNTVRSRPHSSPAVFSFTPLHRSCRRCPRWRSASSTSLLPRADMSPFTKAWSVPWRISSRSYLARWQVGHRLQQVGFALGVLPSHHVHAGVELRLPVDVASEKVQADPVNRHSTSQTAPSSSARSPG